ncbi:MAG TPA: alkaline phosphatase family protein [Streptosporangiaceae bacterium]|nr:alkaline phosphatase family protein [Streptosporangiaceae bacterium]
MGLKSRRRGQRPRVIACGSVLAVMLAAVSFGAAQASAAPRPDPLAHAPSFRRAFGRQVLASPGGVAADPGGGVWVADSGHDRVAGFAPSGRLVTTFGQGLDQPGGITADAAGHVWVADTGHDRVVEFSSAGRVLASLGSAGRGPGQLDQPAGLAVTPFGDVWVADQGNSRVEEFSAAGRYRTSFAVPAPAGVALDARGDIWVSSPSYVPPGNSVREYSPSGRQLRSFGTTQAGYGDLGNPGGIAVGPGGRIYVTQPDYGLVSVFSPAGEFYTEFGLQAELAQADEDLEFPRSVAVAATGQVWVADSGHDRVAQFGRVPGTGAPVGTGGPSWPLIIGECLLALVIAALGWYLARRARSVGVSAVRRPAGRPGPAPAALPPPGLTRRRLLTTATTLSGVAAGTAVLPASLRRALTATLEDPPGGSLKDIEHIVILMQENRSFDHYFGTMPGVRGFADPAAVRLPDGSPVFRQPYPDHAQGYLAPFHLDTKATSAQATPGTDHSWPTQHQAWNNGAMDQWVLAKGPFTMGYFTEADIPFHWALARAFTICDRYHCSVLGPTNPNRLYMWTGTIGPQGTGGGPVTDNTHAVGTAILSWTTYPERLERAGISWQVYQEEDNYDNNALAWFKQFAAAPSSSPLWQRGMRKRPAGWFEADARAGRLPQVSWLVAPTAQSEHPDYFPAAGADYVASKLDAIASNEDLWHRTLFILTYDENDGLFDHMPPPVAPHGTRGEYVRGEPIGPGFRVPAIVVSPWSAGGRVCSDVLDHTSLIRVIERRFAVREPNISHFRRRTCGDFTAALRFSGPRAAYPRSPPGLTLAGAAAGLLTAQHEVFANPAPAVPAANEPVPPPASA